MSAASASKGTGYSVPRPRSGRVDRAACPRPSHAGLWRAVQPKGPLEIALVQNEANAHARWQRAYHRALSGLRRLACQAALRENRIDFVTSLEDCPFDQLPNEARRFVNRGLSRRPAS